MYAGVMVLDYCVLVHQSLVAKVKGTAKYSWAESKNIILFVVFVPALVTSALLCFYVLPATNREM